MILSNSFGRAAIGAATFWATVGAVMFIDFIGGVGWLDNNVVVFYTVVVVFYTVSALLLSWAIMYVYYRKVLDPANKGMLPAIQIGIIGPMAATVLLGLFITGVPACKDSRTITECVQLLGLSMTLGALSVLGYSGMLIAMALNTIASPIMGWLLSKNSYPSK